MQRIYLTIFLVCLVSITTVLSSSNDQADENETTKLVLTPDETVIEAEESLPAATKMFKATREWQKVAPDEMLPKGLHVRLNIQTGEREAKLLDDNNDQEQTTSLSNVEQPDEEDAPKKAVTNIDELKKALKNIKNEAKEEETTEQSDEVKKKFRSFEEIKADMDKLNVNVKTDAEILSSLIVKYKEASDDVAKKLLVLEDLEYYVHQVDNGVVFCDMDGFTMLMNEMNSTSSSDELVTKCALTLGAAIQGNPKVQVFAVKAQFLQLALNLLTKAISSSSSSSPQRHDLVSKLLFALSTVLRSFPFAQAQFVKIGGVQVLNQVIQAELPVKTRVRALTLANDLILEKIQILNSTNDNDNQNDTKIQQYQELQIKEKLLQSNWCKNFEYVLVANADNSNDSLEKIIECMLTMLDDCATHYSQTTLRELKRLRAAFHDKHDDDADLVEYYQNFVKNIDLILSHHNDAKSEL